MDLFCGHKDQLFMDRTEFATWYLSTKNNQIFITIIILNYFYSFIGDKNRKNQNKVIKIKISMKKVISPYT